MFKVGLTGGIGAGKSTVSKLFAELGVPIIDADDIAHALVAKDQPALALIQHSFGQHILTSDGNLDRRALRDIIFADATQKQRLEAILHPLIFSAMQQQADALNTPYCIFAIPLLFETQSTPLVDRIVVVDCPVECQVKRVIARDQQRAEQIQAIINRQVSRTLRCARADDIIDNADSPHTPLSEQVTSLHSLYGALAAKQSA